MDGYIVGVFVSCLNKENALTFSIVGCFIFPMVNYPFLHAFLYYLKNKKLI